MQLTTVKMPATTGLIETLSAQGFNLKITPAGLMADDAASVEAAAFSFSGSASELQWWQAQKLAALAAQYATLMGAGFVFNGHTYQIDSASQQQIAAMGSLAAQVLANTPGVAAWPANFVWIDTANANVPMAASDMFAFAQATAAYVSGCVVANRAIKDAIAAAPNVAAVQALDVTANWPANG